MRVLVCGGRNFANIAKAEHFLTLIHDRRHITLLIEGGAAGADKIAREWAVKNGIEVKTFPANWDALGRRAGPVRNQQMIDEGKPQGVVAFPGGPGTADMIRRAKAAGIGVYQVAA